MAAFLQLEHDAGLDGRAGDDVRGLERADAWRVVEGRRQSAVACGAVEEDVAGALTGGAFPERPGQRILSISVRERTSRAEKGFTS